MEKLLFKSLLLVGEKKEKELLKKYFKEIEVIPNNREILTSYFYNSYTLILLIFNKQKTSNNSSEIINKIHQHNKHAPIAIYSPELSKEELIELIPLNIIGFLTQPFEKKQIETLIERLDKHILLSSEEVLLLHEGCYYDTRETSLYAQNNQKIKLTKNQRMLMEILAQAKYQFVSTEAIEHHIWEEASFEKNCLPRLKNLIYNLRKKLPKNTLINNYSLGYKLECQ